MKLLVISLMMVLAGCASTPPERDFDPNDYYFQIREGLEFKTTPVQTFRFFEQVKQGGGLEMPRAIEVLGENLSTAVLFMEKPVADQLSLQFYPDQKVSARTMNQRISQGASLILTDDVQEVTREGSFLQIRLNVPGILSGMVYMLEDPIDGRTPAEQTFVEYYQTGEEPRKLSVSALLLLLSK